MLSHLFGADGIRGPADLYPLDANGTARLGRALAAWLCRRGPAPSPCLVGADTRESSLRLTRALAEGLARAGVPVIDAGVVPTPAISYLIASNGAFSAGVMISASHNAVEENGIKVFDPCGIKLSDAAEREIEALMAEDERPRSEFKSASIGADPRQGEHYARMLAADYEGMRWQERPVVVDVANGANYRLGPLVFDLLKIPYRLLNENPDGTNINRVGGSEHVRRHPRHFAALIRRYDATAGIALDGDGDRVVLVDRRGRLYDGDMLMAMFAPRLMQRGTLRRGTVVSTQMSNSGLRHYLSQRGITTLTVKNGDKYVTNALLEHDLTLGGEEIGHIILRTDNARVTGDGLRAALHVLSLMSTEGVTDPQDLAPEMRHWPQVTATVRLECRTGASAQQLPGLDAELDRVRHEVPDLTRPIECRPASTEAAYRVMLEARETPVEELARHAIQLGQFIQASLDCKQHPIEIFANPAIAVAD